MITSIVSYHLNPFTCGVARFNRSLANVMGVRIVQLDSFLASGSSESVLLSIKLEEMPTETLKSLEFFIERSTDKYSLLLHGISDDELEIKLCSKARKVFAATREIAATVMSYRPDVVSVFAPGAPVSPRLEEVDCTLLTFGMAHKIRSSGYQLLASLMRSDARTFRLDISTALHEGGAFDETFFQIGDEISRAFEGSVRFLGFLADDEVSERLRSVDALIAFFPRGVRENNTTVLSAMSHGCPVITNLDSLTPPWMIHNETIFDVSQLERIPSKDLLRSVGVSGAMAAKEYSFQKLAEIIVISHEKS
jgi:hypothetical protein